MFLLFSPIITMSQNIAIDFYDDSFNFRLDPELKIELQDSLSQQSIQYFYQKLASANDQSIVQSLIAYKTRHQLNDWLYYQLIRKTAEAISPKKANYNRYTLYKWFFMSKSGYDARLAIGNNQLIFYVRTSEEITDIPYFMVDDHKYMCLNYHDYGKLFNRDRPYVPIALHIPEAREQFSYKVTKMPDFKPEAYHDKHVAFNFNHKAYHFNIKVADEVSNIFANYPVVGFEDYFNIPMSRETYNSLIPALKENVKMMPVKKGVDYLMQFTRYAFIYEDDETYFGQEKRFSPEQTLLNNQSDCDDRAALFFYLVKEIYNLPMIAVLYPTHITMAVQFDKPVGKPITYNGKQYTVYEPTPQKENLKLGDLATHLRTQKFEVVYAYNPKSD
ncbi:MAG: hypothetical protein REI78_16355 [Pedobacter sp.]|nr:hypothetical protein [Pedobacter sp.]